LSKEKREELKAVFGRELALAVTERSELDQRWESLAVMYEARPENVSVPWPGASGVKLPTGATHTDALYARFMNAFFAVDPTWTTTYLNPMWENFALEMRDFLQWISDHQIDLHATYKRAFSLMCRYGCSIVYSPWDTLVKRRKALDMTTNKFVNQEITIHNGPKSFVIPPWNFVIRTGQTNIDEAPWCGFKVRMTPDEIFERGERGFFYKEQATNLLQEFGKPRRELPEGIRDIYEVSISERLEYLAGLSRSGEPMGTVLYHLFATYDVDDDGWAEEVEFFFDPRTGEIPRATYNPYDHMLRPLDKFGLIEREGVFWDIGIMELAEGINATQNVLQRQIIDNNTVQNTKFFTVLKTSDIQPGQKFRPGWPVFVTSHEEIQDRAVGQGQLNTQNTDVANLDDALQKRTGMSDFNLGQESGKRVPATTMLTVVQEGKNRVDDYIRVLRKAAGHHMMKIVEMYHQFKPLGVPYAVLGPRGEVIEKVWRIVGPEPVRNRVLIYAAATTANLNKAVDRTEKGQLFTLLGGFYDKINLQIIPQIMQAQGMGNMPLVNVMLLQYDALRKIMERIVRTHGYPNPAEYIPDLRQELFNVGQATPPGFGAGEAPGATNGGVQGTGPSMETLLGMAEQTNPGAGPATPPGRPLSGFPRLPGTTPTAPSPVEHAS
jgi:hypothetical protein